MASERWPSAEDEAARRIRARDWTASALGPPAGWPQSLTSAADLALALALPAVLFWGRERIAIPNSPALALLATDAAPQRSPLSPEWVERAAIDGVVRDGGTRTTGTWTLAPLRGEDGAIAGVLALQTGAAPPAAVVAELQHQARNAVAWVRSIAKRSAETSSDLDDYAMHLDGRIDAVSRARAASALDPRGVDLTELVAAELLAAAAREDEVATIEGPDVAIAPRAAEVLALALHELATNAIKFGALSASGGRIAVCWTRAGDELVLDWAESGVSGPLAIARSGFGMEVLERTLPYELGATTAFRLPDGGARCTITMPLAPAAAAPR